MITTGTNDSSILGRPSTLSLQSAARPNFKYEPKDFTTHAKQPLVLLFGTFGEEQTIIFNEKEILETFQKENE